MVYKWKMKWLRNLIDDVKHLLISLRKFFTINLCVGIIIMLLCVITIIYVSQNYPGKYWAEYLVLPMSSAIIAGFLVSIVIDIRKQVSDIQDLIVRSFTKFEFLKQLPEEDLMQLRVDALKQINERKYPNMQNGLMSKEKDIFKALTNPYYSTYRETGVYKRHISFKWGAESQEQPALFRRVNIEYIINSPLDESEITVADLSLGKTMDIPPFIDKPKDPKDIFMIKHFVVSIDGGEKRDIVDNLSYRITKLREIDNYYNSHIKVVYCGNENGFRSHYGQECGIFVDFHKSIEVQVVYEVYLPINDAHFTSRLKYPAKSFRIDCVCEDDQNVRFHGELLGTFTSAKQRKITHVQNNMLSIEAFDWLLPKNGVFVVMSEENKPSNNKI